MQLLHLVYEIQINQPLYPRPAVKPGLYSMRAHTQRCDTADAGER